MKFETTAGLLRSALSLVGHTIETRTTIPVLSTVLFDSKVLRGTNLDMEISISVPASSGKGKACIAHRPLLNLVRHIAKDDIVRIEAGKDSAAISFPSGRYDLPCLPASDYPEIFSDDHRQVPVDGGAFKRALAFASSFISTEPTRYYLNGACLDGDVAVATDGHRLGCHPLGFDGAPFERSIIPRGAVALLGLLSAPKQISLWKKAHGITIAVEGGMLRTRLIDGTFPNWRRVVPACREDASTISFERQELLRSVSRILATSRRLRNGVSLAWNASRVAVVGKSYLHEATAREYLIRAAVVAGKPGSISLDASYVRDILGAIRSDTVTATVHDASAPVLWRSDGEAFAVLMPMQKADEGLASETLSEWVNTSEIGRAA